MWYDLGVQFVRRYGEKSLVCSVHGCSPLSVNWTAHVRSTQGFFDSEGESMRRMDLLILFIVGYGTAFFAANWVYLLMQHEWLTAIVMAPLLAACCILVRAIFIQIADDHEWLKGRKG